MPAIPPEDEQTVLRASDFRPDIEGLRGVAILLVILYHAGVPGFTGGFVGVDVFFVLSGYLITRLIAAEIEATGGLSFRQFYARRARRLLPAAALVTLATLAIGRFVLAPFEQHTIAETALATAGYVSNLYFAANSLSYFAAGPEHNPLLHTWSLGVEEQFYLLWPVLTAVALRGGRRRLAIAIAVVASLSLASSLWLTDRAQPWAFFASPTRGWEFAAGALACLIPVHWGHRRAPLLGWAGLASVVGAAVAFDATTRFPGGAALLPVAGTALLLIAGAAVRTGPLQTFLASAPMQALGRVSYGWYLWHWPVLVYATILLGDLSWGFALLLCILALGLAEVTFRLVENPIRRAPSLAPRPIVTIGGAFALTAFTLAIAAAGRSSAGAAMATPSQVAFTRAANDWPAAYTAGCHLDFLETEPPACAFGPDAADTTVVLFGDSHALQWFPALERLASERGWRVVSLTKAACPAADVVIDAEALNRRYRECEEWRTRMLQRIVELRPVATVLSNSRWYLSLLPAADWEVGVARVLATLRASGIPTLLVQDTPRPGFPVPTCLARLEWTRRVADGTCVFPRVRQRDEVGARLERAAAARIPGVVVADFSTAICGTGTLCAAARDGQVLYLDHDHLTATFSASLAPQMALALHAAIAAGATAPRDDRP
jgi:peptidoglycan/LPS O-acetylase OafA/YrhL